MESDDDGAVRGGDDEIQPYRRDEKKKSKMAKSMNLAFGSNAMKINPKIMIR